MIAEADQGLPSGVGAEGAGLPSAPGAGSGHPCWSRQARLAPPLHRQAVRWVAGCKARFERGDLRNYKKKAPNASISTALPCLMWIFVSILQL